MPNANHRNAAAAISGTWRDRSYPNAPGVVVGDDPAKAISLLFGEGVMTFDVNQECVLRGTFDIGGNMLLDLTGTVSAPNRMEQASRTSPPHSSWCERPGLNDHAQATTLVR
jgi:hypothetical protein